METTYAVSFHMAEQEIVTYTEKEWNDFLAEVQDLVDGEEFDTVGELLDLWGGDEFFWNYV